MSREPRSSGPADRLHGEAELSGLYRDPAEPPPELDRRILAASRRAVAAGPQGRRSGRPQWAASLSVAAVLVLAVTLISLMPRERPAPVSETAPAEHKGTTAPDLNQAADAPTARSPHRAEEPLPAAAPAHALDQDQAANAKRERRQQGLLLESDLIEPPTHPAAPGEVMDPELWRGRIEALVELGDYAQAGRELAAFRERYPDYPPGALERRLEGLTE